MNEDVFVAIITHGELACALAKVAENLMASDIQLHCFSSQVLSSEEIIKRLENQIEKEKPKRILIFVDLIGGGCWIIANKIKKNNDYITVIAGVNVPMVVSFLINLKRQEWEPLIEKIVIDAQKGIVVR